VIKTRTIVLLLAALGMLVLLPLFLSPNLLNAAIKMMIAALFALAFTLAMGQAGMLSFGHAAYYGLGAFAALHLMRAVEQKLFGFPTPLIPLAGALVGFVFGLAFGWFATQRTGVYFSMVTLALAELLLTLAPTWNALFGGESGISTMRGASWGVSFGDDAHVYYLTLGWFVVSAWCMWAFTKTPVGRLALALRDNEQRVRFLGFNAHVARTLIFAISCLFAGVAGALLAIANEATNYTIFSAQASANVVLQTFIGGAGTFFGPALGAIIMTFFARVTSDLTRSWLLYQGLIFVLVMLFAPQGLGGLVALHARRVKAGGWKHLVAPYLLCLAVGLLLIAGLVFVVESIHAVMTDAYLAKRTAAQGEWVPYELFGRSFEPASPATWAIPIMLLAIGGWLLPPTRRITQRAWLAATRDLPGEPAAPSPAVTAGQGAPP
jgi:branched-chain amino acid transport system permease protein